MTFSSLLRTLRDRWLYLVAGVLVGLLAGVVVTLLTPRTYSSTSSMYVSAFDNSQSAQSAYQGSLLSQQRVKSYSELLVSDRVLQSVVDQLRLPETTEDLTGQVAVGSSTDSTILTVTVTDENPGRAASIANGIAERFTQVVGELERPSPNAAPAVIVNVVDPAKPVLTPVSPRLPVNIVVGVVVGLVVAAGAALVRGTLDRTLRTSAGLAGLAGASSLGTLPTSPSIAEGAAMASLDDVQYAEAVRRIRTNLLFADVDKPPTTLVITSSVPSEGKTTLVCTLASALAATNRVAILEGDLRRPSIAARLGLVGTVGLTDVLTRRVGLRDAMQPWGTSGVDVLACGTLPPNPSELLSSKLMGEVLGRLAADYDLVLVDGPPLVPVSDGAILAGHAHGALLLCRTGSTTHSQVQSSVDALAAVGARVVGSVLTMVARDRDDRAYYGYRTAPAPVTDRPATAKVAKHSDERPGPLRSSAASDHVR
ncbi:MAG: polysaccharide biosynthesis tyrosine autokinase [Pseudonocardia sediminis]